MVDKRIAQFLKTMEIKTTMMGGFDKADTLANFKEMAMLYEDIISELAERISQQQEEIEQLTKAADGMKIAQFEIAKRTDRVRIEQLLTDKEHLERALVKEEREVSRLRMELEDKERELYCAHVAGQVDELALASVSAKAFKKKPGNSSESMQKKPDSSSSPSKQTTMSSPENSGKSGVESIAPSSNSSVAPAGASVPVPLNNETPQQAAPSFPMKGTHPQIGVASGVASQVQGGVPQTAPSAPSHPERNNQGAQPLQSVQSRQPNQFTASAGQNFSQPYAAGGVPQTPYPVQVSQSVGSVNEGALPPLQVVASAQPVQEQQPQRVAQKPLDQAELLLQEHLHNQRVSQVKTPEGTKLSFVQRELPNQAGQQMSDLMQGALRSDADSAEAIRMQEVLANKSEAVVSQPGQAGTDQAGMQPQQIDISGIDVMASPELHTRSKVNAGEQGSALNPSSVQQPEKQILSSPAAQVSCFDGGSLAVSVPLPRMEDGQVPSAEVSGSFKVVTTAMSGSLPVADTPANSTELPQSLNQAGVSPRSFVAPEAVATPTSGLMDAASGLRSTQEEHFQVIDPYAPVVATPLPAYASIPTQSPSLPFDQGNTSVVSGVLTEAAPQAMPQPVFAPGAQQPIDALSSQPGIAVSEEASSQLVVDGVSQPIGTGAQNAAAATSISQVTSVMSDLEATAKEKEKMLDELGDVRKRLELMKKRVSNSEN